MAVLPSVHRTDALVHSHVRCGCGLGLHQLAASDQTFALELWQVSPFKLRRVLAGHVLPVNCVAFDRSLSILTGHGSAVPSPLTRK